MGLNMIGERRWNNGTIQQIIKKFESAKDKQVNNINIKMNLSM